MRTTPYAGLLGLLLLVGCTSSPAQDEPSAAPLPAEESFSQGTCRLVAPDVIAIGRAIPDLGTGGMVDPAVKDALREAQDQLFAVAEAAEPELKPVITDLVEKVGIVRIRADGNTYEPAQGELLQTSYDAAVKACTGPAPSAG